MMVDVWFETEIEGIGDVTVEAGVRRYYETWPGGRRAVYEVTSGPSVFVSDDLTTDNQNKERDVTEQLTPKVLGRLEERACELYEEFANG